MTEARLDPSWRWVRLGDVATVNSRPVPDPANSEYERFVSSDCMDRFDLRVSRWHPASEVTSSKKSFGSGDYLFVGRSLYASDFRERAARVDFSGVSSNGIIAIRERPEMVADGFLAAVLNHPRIWEFVVKNATGTLTRYVYWKTLKEYKFALPPIEEQRRIAAVLDAANRALEAIRSAEQQSAALRDRLIVELIESGTTRSVRRSFGIGSFPSHWKICALGERYEIQLGKMMSAKAREGPDQTPYLRNSNVQWNELNLDEVDTMAFSDKEKDKFSLKPGDILACEGRHVGKAAIWRNELPGACYQKALHRLRSISGDDHPEYLLHCLRYFSISGRFLAETGETTIPHLPAVRFRAMLFPFPPREEQVEIAEAIGRFDSAIQDIGNRKSGVSNLLSACIREVAGDR